MRKLVEICDRPVLVRFVYLVADSPGCECYVALPSDGESFSSGGEAGCTEQRDLYSEEV